MTHSLINAAEFLLAFPVVSLIIFIMSKFVERGGDNE